ncbi:hypothetical protein HGI44_02500 [Helicobacter pylori]|nr:hypothetical protein HGI44_02500 [Helicobacter pylori]
MRQTRETKTSFNQLKEITQSIQALETNQNANAKKGVLKPTKKAFSERQKTTIRELIQESANARTKNQPSQPKRGQQC